jgi:hypothetical protein
VIDNVAAMANPDHVIFCNVNTKATPSAAARTKKDSKGTTSATSNQQTRYHNEEEV